MNLFTIVLIPGETEDIERKVVQTISPYYVNNEFDRECGNTCECIGRQAGFDVMNQMLQEKGPRSKEGERFYEEYKDVETWEQFNKLWQQKVEEPRNQRLIELFNSHPLKDAPDFDCPYCNGTGLYTKTFDSDFRYDSWSIGGIFDGLISNTIQKPEISTDKQLREVDEKNVLAKDAEPDFNFAEDFSRRLEERFLDKNFWKETICHDDESPFDQETIKNNICHVKDIPLGCIPNAIVTPKGAWTYVDWASIAGKDNPVSVSTWEEALVKIYNLYPDYLAVGCHTHR